jgi:hypothetical protein
MHEYPPSYAAYCFLSLGREDMALVSVKVAGQPLASDDYVLKPTSLTILPSALPTGEFDLEIITNLKPQAS